MSVIRKYNDSSITQAHPRLVEVQPGKWVGTTLTQHGPVAVWAIIHTAEPDKVQRATIKLWFGYKSRWHAATEYRDKAEAKLTTATVQRAATRFAETIASMAHV